MEIPGSLSDPLPYLQYIHAVLCTYASIESGSHLSNSARQEVQTSQFHVALQRLADPWRPVATKMATRGDH